MQNMPPLSVGDRILSGRAVLAPMSGVTDVVMRRIAWRFGASMVVSEMVASDEFVLGNEEYRLRAEGSGLDLHVVQLAGCEPRWMGEAAKLAEQSGADIIDINMGCPAKRVTGGYAGSALMRDLDHAAALIKATVDAVQVPVTVKMRLGWDHASMNAPELAKRAERLGVRLITVHGRTRNQFYKGHADWSAIRKTREAISIPLIANGDGASTDQAKRMLELSGADGVMIGRAALGKPWLIGQIARGLRGEDDAPPEFAERRAAAIDHYEGLLALMGVAIGVKHVRKHIAAYVDDAAEAGRPLPQSLRQILLTTEEPNEALAILKRLYDEVDDLAVRAVA